MAKMKHKIDRFRKGLATLLHKFANAVEPGNKEMPAYMSLYQVASRIELKKDMENVIFFDDKLNFLKAIKQSLEKVGYKDSKSFADQDTKKLFLANDILTLDIDKSVGKATLLILGKRHDTYVSKKYPTGDKDEDRRLLIPSLELSVDAKNQDIKITQDMMIRELKKWDKNNHYITNSTSHHLYLYDNKKTEIPIADVSKIDLTDIEKLVHVLDRWTAEKASYEREEQFKTVFHHILTEEENLQKTGLLNIDDGHGSLDNFNTQAPIKERGAAPHQT